MNFKPFPKIMGAIGVLTALYGALESAGIFAMLPPKWAGGVALLGSVLAWFSHSATGTGGKTPPVQKPSVGA